MEPLYRSGAPLPSVTSVSRSHHCACYMQYRMSCISTASVWQLQIFSGDLFRPTWHLDLWLDTIEKIAHICIQILCMVWFLCLNMFFFFLFKHHPGHGLLSLYSNWQSSDSSPHSDCSRGLLDCISNPLLSLLPRYYSIQINLEAKCLQTRWLRPHSAQSYVAWRVWSANHHHVKSAGC